MKKLGILFASVFLLGLVFQSCNNGKTYAEMKEEEREAIKRFIEREDINVISFEQFQEQDSTTNVKSLSATFTEGIMYNTYGTPYVPSGWLIPFNYIKVGREISGRSKIRLIVPHSEGQSDASASVYPCYYEITYQLAR